MTFERTRDFGLIRGILTRREIWPHIGDDGSGAPKDFRVNEDARIWYVLARENGALLGLFLLLPQNLVCYEIHVSMLPSAWGARALAAARGVVPWFFRAEPRCRRIVAAIPATNRLALRYARRAGFREWGRNPRAFLKGGALVDVVHLGVSREEFSMLHEIKIVLVEGI